MFVVAVVPLHRADKQLPRRTRAEVGSRVANHLKQRAVRPIVFQDGDSYLIIVPTVPYTDFEKAAGDARALLRYLEKEFATEEVKIDLEASSPTRILPLPGTLTEGNDQPDQPKAS